MLKNPENREKRQESVFNNWDTYCHFLSTYSFNVSEDNSPVPSKRPRSSMVPFCWKEKCFLCAKKAVQDAKNPNRIVVHHVTTIELRGKVIEQYNIWNDDWGNNVYTRLTCSNSLVADEGIYHKICLTRFMLNWPSPDSVSNQKGRPVDENMQQWFRMLIMA